MMLLCGLNDFLPWYILTEINHLESIIPEHQRHQILTDIVNITLYRSNHHRGHFLIRLPFHKHRFQIFYGCLHSFRAGDQSWQEVFPFVE